MRGENIPTVAPYGVRFLGDRPADLPRALIGEVIVSARSHLEAAEEAVRNHWRLLGENASPVEVAVRYTGHDPLRAVRFEVWAQITATATLVLEEADRASVQIIVLTTQIGRAQAWLHVECGINPRDPRLIYVEREDQLRGRAGAILFPAIDYEYEGSLDGGRRADRLRAAWRSQRIVTISLDELVRVIGKRPELVVRKGGE